VQSIRRKAIRLAPLATMTLLSAASLSAAAPVPDRPGSSFAIVAPPVDSAAVLTVRPNSAFLKLDVRPLLAVTLDAAIPAAVAVQFGAKEDVPFDRGRQLYGWPERPGFYCDLLRSRGLGLSTACLRDTDMDGRFDEGLRLDFNSGSGDILGITPSGKIIGVRYKGKPVPLPAPLPYSSSKPAPGVTGKLALRWARGSKRAGTADNAELWISTPENYTGTEGLSERILSFPRDRAPLDVELYGVKLRIRGFDDKGAMQYSVLGVTDGVPVPLFFRGYRFIIIGY
jgi:hypothetical protein